MCQFQIEICFKYETHRASQVALVVKNLQASAGETLRQPGPVGKVVNLLPGSPQEPPQKTGIKTRGERTNSKREKDAASSSGAFSP